MKCGHGLVLGAQSGLLTLNIAQFPGRRFLIIDRRQKPQGTAGPQRARPDPSNPRRPACTSMSATGDVAPAPEDGRQMRRKPPRRKPPMEAATTPPLCGPRRPGPPHPPRHQDHPLHPVDRAPGHQGPELPLDPAGSRRRLAGPRRNMVVPPRTPLDTENIPLYIGEDFFLKKINATSQYPGIHPLFSPSQS